MHWRERRADCEKKQIDRNHNAVGPSSIGFEQAVELGFVAKWVDHQLPPQSKGVGAPRVMQANSASVLQIHIAMIHQAFWTLACSGFWEAPAVGSGEVAD